VRPAAPLRQVLAVASDDGRAKCFAAATGEPVCELTGHEDAVQAVAFDRGGQFMVSASSDCTFKLWAG
jgi:WD40 repeat protein